MNKYENYRKIYKRRHQLLPQALEQIVMHTKIFHFYDLNYHKSKLHNILESKDIKVIVGLDMLIYQAIKSIEIWLDHEFSNKIDIKEIKTYLKKKALC